MLAELIARHNVVLPLFHLEQIKRNIGPTMETGRGLLIYLTTEYYYKLIEKD